MKPCLHIAMYVPGLAFGPETLTTHSLGGSETAGLSIAQALKDRGHRVYLFCNREDDNPGTDRNLQFLDINDFSRFVSFMQHDVTVVQRVPSALRYRTQSKLTVAWQHDMALIRHQGEFMAAMWNVDQIALLSDYMVDQYRQVFGEKAISDKVVWKTRNGIHTELFPGDRERDKKLLVYSARPERGLDYLLDKIMPRLIERDPEYRLIICGYDNPATELQEFYDHCRALAAPITNNVKHVGSLSKPELYELYAKAGAYVYPTPSPVNQRFREISCITAMECMAAGLPFISSDAGALPETLAEGAGTLIEGLPGSEGYDEAFCDAVQHYAENPEAHARASKIGREAAPAHDWATVAEEWESRFIEKIEAKNQNERRRSLYFARRGDGKAAGIKPKGKAPEAPANPQQSGVLFRWLKEKPEIITVLDFGRCPDLRDHLPGVEFHSEPREGCAYDAILFVNRLEYLPEPWKELNRWRKHLSEEGWLMACAPYGPHYTEGRLWDFEAPDIEDMIEDVPGFDLFAFSGGADEATADPIGWLYFKCRDGKISAINMNRKLRMQSPRETLSVNIICGGQNAHQNLHWCLDSVHAIADEIVIGDTGMPEEARRIAQQYEKVRIIPASDPLEHGFETPRNEILAESRMDWILWIDADEKLIGGNCLTKYLRNSIYDGFSIKQHHFGIDIRYDPDMPVRVFRNTGEIRFYGMIHEHPEAGINKGPGMVVVVSDVDIMHVGYEDESVRQKRFWRNRPLLEKDRKKYPDRLLQKHFIMRDNMILTATEINTNGGQLTAKAKELCEETIDLWRTHFKGGCDLVNIDATQYYNQACSLLGIGVDIHFDFAAGKDGYGGVTNGSGRRYANEDDLIADMTDRAKRQIDPYLKEHW